MTEENWEIVGYEKVPRLQRCMNQVGNVPRSAGVIYFHTKDNPYGNYPAMMEELRGSAKERILTRAYGVPTKATLTRFPLFRDPVHVVSLNKFNQIAQGGGTWYHFLDPCSGRNWFQIWVFIDPLGRKFVRAESPSHGHDGAYIPGVGDPGPWTLPGKQADGAKGPGQTEWGWGYKRYLEEIARVEALLAQTDQFGNHETRKEHGFAGGEAKQGNPETLVNGAAAPHHGFLASELTPSSSINIFERWIDARYGNARKTAEESSTTLIDDLIGLGMDFLAAPSEKAIDSGRGGGDGSLRMINDALFYDAARPIDHTNQPSLYVVETCPNVIYALKEWTGLDGQHGACKDPIDVLRMLVLSGVGFVDRALLKVRQPWMGQFQN
jgi:hypothetical protein